jgi:hypothetical protein
MFLVVASDVDISLSNHDSARRAVRALLFVLRSQSFRKHIFH